MASMFTPPKTKSSAVRKACICHWGDLCAQLTTFYNKQNDHHLKGVAKVRYSNSCNFQNFLQAAKVFLRVPQATLSQLQQEYDAFVQDPSQQSCPRIVISKFHFPCDFVKTNPRWTTPLTEEDVANLVSYKTRSPPPHADKLLKFDPSLGAGLSVHSKKSKGDGDTKLYRAAPFRTKKEATDIAAEAQNTNETNKSKRLDFDSIRRAYEAEQQREREELEELDIESRTPEEWMDLVASDRSVIQSKENAIGALQSQVLQLKRQLQSQQEEINGLNIAVERHKKRAKRVESSSLENEIEDTLANEADKLAVFVAREGGISRLTMCSNEWHDLHKDAARLFWGYNSWKETKLYVKAYFPELDTSFDPSKHIKLVKDDTMYKLPPLSAFEQCLITRMFFHTFSEQQIVALIVNRDRTRIGQILKDWAPRWANVGIDLSCLDIDEDYLSKEVPDKNVELKKDKLVYVDGKDYLCAPKRNDTTIERAQFSSKSDKTAARDLTWSTAAGLIFEFSPLFGGRGGERQIVEWMGSLGPMCAPIEDWKGVAQTDPFTPAADTFWTALEDAMTPQELEEALDKLENGSPLVSNGLLDDGILMTGQPTGLAREGLNDGNESDEIDSDDEEPNVSKDSARDVFGISDALSKYEAMVKHALVEQTQRESGEDKRPPVLTSEILKEQNKKALRNDPNQSAKRKLCQLERLQRLHLLYESGDLDKCLLSYFLLVTETSRLRLLRWMGSDLAAHIPMPTAEELGQIPLRLAKIPERIGVGGDKGFSGIERYMPNGNDADTPPGVVNSKKERLSKEQIEAEIPITTVRGGCETVFKRVMAESALREKIPYWLFRWLPHAHALAHGEANLCKPLRYPGRRAVVGSDYWENEKNYTTIQQPHMPSQNIETSERRVCRKCKLGGVVQMCNVCKKFFHDNEKQCHDYENCIANPYI